MKKKPLRIHLDKAEYILVFFKEFAPVLSQTIKSPPLNLSKIIKSNNLNRLAILQIPFQRKENLKKLLFSCQNKDLPSVNTINTVSNHQNLHLLEIGKIYYANQGKRIKGWKLPRLVQLTSQFQAIFNSPLIKISNSNNRRYKVIKRAGIGIIENYQSFEEAEKDNLALENQHSRRRNYLTSRPLHT